MEQVDAAGAVNWASLAQRLGYFEQAHSIKDFKAMAGLSPEEYARGGTAQETAQETARSVEEEQVELG